MLSRNDASSQVVFAINAGVAIGVGIAAARALKLSTNAGLVIAAVAFAGLMACLMSARTAWFATIAGSTAAGVAAGYMSGELFTSRLTWVIGGGAIGAGAFALTFLFYRRLVTATTGAGEMAGRYAGTFNEMDERRRRGTGNATVVVSAAQAGDHDLRLTGLVVGGLSVEMFGKRRDEEDKAPSADLSLGKVEGPGFVLLRGWAQFDGAMLIVDLEGSPFGTYVFTGQRQS